MSEAPSSGSASGASSGDGREALAPGSPSSRRSGRQKSGVYACVFWLDGQRYALDTVRVVEAIIVTQLAPVPLSPPWLLGLTSLRGTPLPVVELPLVLALGRASPLGDTAAGWPALVLRLDELLVAGRVERLEAVYAFDGMRFEAAAANEHAAVRGLLDAGGAAVPATLLDHDQLARRLHELRRNAGFGTR